jgi:hypothetical protein
MLGNGAIFRRSATLTVGQLRDHLANMNEDTPIVFEVSPGSKMNIHSASNPSASDLPILVLGGSNDYTATSVGM